MKLQVLFMEHWLGIEVEFGLGTAVTDGEIDWWGDWKMQRYDTAAEYWYGRAAQQQWQ